MKKALLIGINYRNSIPNNELPDCEKDVDDMQVLLESQGYVVDKFYEYTPTEFLAYIKNINSTMTKEDTLLIQYSGHGCQISVSTKIESDRIQEALVMYKNRKFVYFLDKDFVKVTNTIIPKSIIIFDSCFAGGMTTFLPTNTISRFIEPQEGVEVFDMKPFNIPSTKNIANRLDLISCAEEETSISTGTNGLYTKSLLEGYKAGKKKVGTLNTFSKKFCKGQQSPQLRYIGFKSTTVLF